MPIPPPDADGYVPSMILETKCTWCGQKFRKLGHKAFDAALDKHRETCKEPQKKSRKKK